MQAVSECQCKIKDKWHRSTDIDCEAILVKEPTLVYQCLPCRHNKGQHQQWHDTTPANAWDPSLYQTDYPLSEARHKIP